MVLHLSILVFLRRSRKYFCWKINIPCFDLGTSIPYKYFKYPKSFIPNLCARDFFNLGISSSSFPITIISSTYTIKTVTCHWNECLMKSVWSNLWIAQENCLNHALRNCFRPYKTFFSLHTLPIEDESESSSPRGTSIYTSSFKSPWRSAFFTSNWCRGQFKFVDTESMTLIEFVFATGANVSS
jgi:hypothetical protein